MDNTDEETIEALEDLDIKMDGIETCACDPSFPSLLERAIEQSGAFLFERIHALHTLAEKSSDFTYVVFFPQRRHASLPYHRFSIARYSN